MPFLKFPFLVLVFFVIFGGGEVVPFLLIAFCLWFVAGAVGHTVRSDRRSVLTTDDLATLRTAVADGLLDLDDDLRMVTDAGAKAHFEAAGVLYTRAANALDRGANRRDRRSIADTLYRARYELEAASAILDGASPPRRDRARVPVTVTVRPRWTRRPACYRW